MSCFSRSKRNTRIDPLFSERTSLRLTLEKNAAGFIGSNRAQQMNDATLHTFLLRRNNQPKPVVYADIYKRRSSPGNCFGEGNIFTITDFVSSYTIRDNNNILRTGSYYIPSTINMQNPNKENPILFFFRGESKTDENDLARDIYYLEDIYSKYNDPDNPYILISMHPLQSNDSSYNYNIFDNTDGIDNDRLVNIDDINSLEFILNEARNIIKLASSSPVYARGHSEGGNFCYQLAKQTNIVNGIIVSGANFIENNLEPPTSTDLSYVFIIHGENDTLVPYDFSYNDTSFNTTTPYLLGLEYYDTKFTANQWLNLLKEDTETNINAITDINSNLIYVNIGTEQNRNIIDIVNFNYKNNNTGSCFNLWKYNDGNHNIPKKLEEEIMNQFMSISKQS